MESANNLTIEQQFHLQVLSQEIRQMSREQAQQHLMELLHHLMVKDNVVKQILKGQLLHGCNDP